MTDAPRVAIGMPVHNGSDFIREAIDSILDQTLADLRLVIGDNASTDGTSDICKEYARMDSRVVHVRHTRNLGAHPNFNFVYQPRGAPYFKWAGHDDVLEPTYLERCVGLLDERPDAVLAQSMTIKIFATDHPPHPWQPDMLLSGPRPRDRLWRVLWVTNFQEHFGVLRTRLVDQTHLMGSYLGSDTNFLAELLMLGDVAYVDEYLFKRRAHAESYTGGAVQGVRERSRWFDTGGRTPRLHPGVTRLEHHIRSVVTAPLPIDERLACIRVIFDWGARRGLEVITGRGDRRRTELIALARAGREDSTSKST